MPKNNQLRWYHVANLMAVSRLLSSCRGVPYERVMRRASVAAILAGMLLASGCNGSKRDHTDDIVAGPTPSPAAGGVGVAIERERTSRSFFVGERGAGRNA